jgi:hypothetical protein
MNCYNQVDTGALSCTIRLSEKYNTETEQNEQNNFKNRLGGSYGDSFYVRTVSAYQLFHGRLLRVPYPAGRIHHDDGRSAQ